MKSKVKSSINYTGTVTLSMYRGSKKIKLLQVHNKGNNQLFEFLGHCFLGETALAEAKRPSKIRLLSIPDPKGTARGGLRQASHQSATPLQGTVCPFFD